MPPLHRRLVYSLLVMACGLGAIEGGLRGWGAWERARLGPDPVAPEAEAPLLLAVGDSVTQGIPVDPPWSWPGWMRRDPAAGARGYEVVPLGYGGKGWHHLDTIAARWLAQAPPARPITMVVLAGHNDCNYLAAPGAVDAPLAMAGGVRGWLGRLATYRLLVQVVARGGDAVAAYGEVAPPDTRGDAGAHCTRQLTAGIARFQTLAAQHEARLVVASYPLPGGAASALSRVNAQLNPVLLSEAQRRGVEALDLSRCTWQQPDEAMFQPDRVHMTAEGYRQLARCIGAGLGLPPGVGEVEPVLPPVSGGPGPTPPP